MNQFTKLIAAQLNLKEQAVENTLALLDEAAPFRLSRDTARRKPVIWTR